MRAARVAVLAALVAACRPAGPASSPAPGSRHLEQTASPEADGQRAAGAAAYPRSVWRLAHRASAAALDRPAADRRLLAVLLPLSGPQAAVGRALRPAVELAAAGNDDVRFVFLDSGSGEADAIAAVERAVAGGAALVLGPVGAAAARAAARRAVRLGVPIALLAPDAAAASPSDGVFRLVPSAESEARDLARLVVEAGHDRVAILAPDDEQGAAQAAAFAAAASAAGAEVARTGTYDPTALDLETSVRRFLGLVAAANPRLARHLRRTGKDGWKTFSPDLDFDLLYVPDEHARLALVAAYLPYFNVELRRAAVMDTLALRAKHGGRLPAIVQLLGSSGWHHPGLAAAGGAAIDGAVFAARCRGAAGDEPSSDAAAGFIAAYRQRTGAAPGAAAMQVHDAARLVVAARPRAGGGFAAALAGAVIDDGVCGPGRVDADGQLARLITLLEVDAGDLVPHEH